MTDLIITWGDVRPGDQALSDGSLITVDDVQVYPQDGYPDFLIASVGGINEDGRRTHVSPSAQSLTAVRREADAEAPSTVTVTAADGREHSYEAADYLIDATGRLGVAAEKDSSGSVFASFPDGRWSHAEIDGHRAPAGTDPGARITELEAVISDISGTAWHENAEVERLEVIKERLRRYRETGK